MVNVTHDNNDRRPGLEALFVLLTLVKEDLFLIDLSSAYLQRMGKLWVMWYFGFGWDKEHSGKAWDTFACSYDLVHWTDWQGEPLIEPSEEFDAQYAHKPCVVKYKGVVYHFYCAVSKNGSRGIAVATSKDMGKSSVSFPKK